MYEEAKEKLKEQRKNYCHKRKIAFQKNAFWLCIV